MKKIYPHIWLYAMLFIMLLLLVPRAGFEGDVGCWVRWGTHIHDQGLRNAYEHPGNNYNPFYHYVLWAYGKLVGTPEKIQRYRHALKAFTLLFDFAGAIMLAALATPGSQRRFMLSLLLLFNIGYLYNTLVWEQIDAILTFFAALAVVLALRKNITLSVLAYVIAFNVKPQAIIFLPPLFFLWLPLLRTRGIVIGQAIGAAVVLQLLILTPFVWMAERSGWPRLVEINLHAADMYPFISMSARNLWTFIAPDGPFPLISAWDDTTVGALGLTYRQWGLILFMLCSAIALLPLLLLCLMAFRQKRQQYVVREQALVLISCATIPLLFTYLNTQMHERYWHAAVLFLGGYGFLTGRYQLLILVSVAYTIQLEAILRFLELKNYGTLLFNAWLNATMFTVSVVWAIAEIYRIAPVRRMWASLTSSIQGSNRVSNPLVASVE
ncbi:hypothetical protein H8B15_06565 [Hymenobacter sp. BT507]|uniref:DUF2029 domain-containing protein n=1 Tax=Hymenobacter citatus TaxID=2763506 RepID=A0ABR7MHL1_9BACT|nr:hypothetical protein [Hymenobacter citatus]MBC6610576.1 hypothetical protein [Hymenobacter citatus]